MVEASDEYYVRSLDGAASELAIKLSRLNAKIRSTSLFVAINNNARFDDESRVYALVICSTRAVLIASRAISL